MHFTREQRDSWMEVTRDSPFNRWLRDRVLDRSGKLDLEALHNIAAKYGVDSAAYSHLNPGQQRMNIGNRLRKLVPPAVYMSGDEPPPRKDISVEPPGSSSVNAEHRTSTLLAPDASDRNLMRVYAAVLDELRERNVVRTANAPLGDYAEHLFAKAFGWTLADNSAAGYDASDVALLRFQIKARRLRSDAPGERQLSVIRNLPGAKFDMLAAVLFDKQFNIARAALIPHGVVVGKSKYIAHVNGWRLMLEDAIWREPGVRDVTLALAAAQ